MAAAFLCRRGARNIQFQRHVLRYCSSTSDINRYQERIIKMEEMDYQFKANQQGKKKSKKFLVKPISFENSEIQNWGEKLQTAEKIQNRYILNLKDSCED